MKKKKKKDDIIESILEHQEELLDEKYISIIRNAMRRIPFYVIGNIAYIRNVRFFTITDQFYAVTKHLYDPNSAVPPKKRKRDVWLPVNWQLIMFNHMIMNKLNSEDKQAVIANEIAHVYLKHDYSGSFNEKTKKDSEQEADDLIRSWGFEPTVNLKHEYGSQSQGAQTTTWQITKEQFVNGVKNNQANWYVSARWGLSNHHMLSMLCREFRGDMWRST